MIAERVANIVGLEMLPLKINDLIRSSTKQKNRMLPSNISTMPINLIERIRIVSSASGENITIQIAVATPATRKAKPYHTNRSTLVSNINTAETTAKNRRIRM
jgi:hypothetical protein